MGNVASILSPDRAAMLQHLGVLFGRAMTGRIELTAIKVTGEGEHVSPRTHFFRTDELEDAADWAFKVNSEHMWNVYVGAATRINDVFPGKAATDADFHMAWAIHADVDGGHDLEAVRQAYRAAHITPPFIVVTGRTPSTRAQMWWPLEEPISDPDEYRRTLRGVAQALNTDPSVTAAKQLMRLGGGINWPKKADRIMERTELHTPSNTLASFPIEQIHRAFPPADSGSGPSVTTDIEVAHVGALGLQEQVMDGREAYAFRLIRAHMREWMGTTGTEPTADELYREVAPIYLAKADQVRPGRGPEWLKHKVADAIRAFEAGLIPGMRSLEEAVQTWSAKARGEGVDPLDDDAAELPDDDGLGQSEKPVSRPFRASAFCGEPPEREWIAQEWIVEGAVNSLYGDGGLGKTLLAQMLACSVSMGVPWIGIPTKQGSVLAILCEDDHNELWRRHNNIKASMGHAVGNPFEDVWLWPRVGDDNVLIRWDRDGKPDLGPFAAQMMDVVRELEPSLLILDTLADFYGGNEIDRPQVNYFVKTVLGGLVKERGDAGKPLTVLLLGHPSVAGKASGSGFSGSTAWNNAVRSRMYLTRPEEGSGDERVLVRGKANYAKSGDDTAVRLFFDDGVLHAADNVDDGDSMLWAAKRDIQSLVSKAWAAGEPYSAQKGHRRFIHTLLPGEMQRGGFGPQIVRQAIRECIDDGAISVSKSNTKRGYRAGQND